MDPSEYELMFKVEDDHWWYRGMKAITTSLLDRFFSGRTDLRVLDAGCGTGAAMTGYLASLGTVVGIDLSSRALGYCRKRGASRLVRGSVAELPFASANFDLVTSFDVLYEDSVPQDLPAVREFSRVLKVGGRLLIRLPAYDWLRGRHDRVIHTARRYVRRRVQSLLELGGFKVEHISYANTILFPLALVMRTAERLLRWDQPRSDLALPTGSINGLLGCVLALEAPLVAKYRLPYGLSIVAVAQKAMRNGES
jgi:SAM-dependent methyltransferase